MRLRLLGILLASVGLPPKPSRARLIMDLRDDDKLDEVRGHITAAGKDPSVEVAHAHTSKPLHDAYLASYPHYGNAAQAAQALRAEYPSKVDDISIADMLAIGRRALVRNGASARSSPDDDGRTTVPPARLLGHEWQTLP